MVARAFLLVAMQYLRYLGWFLRCYYANVRVLWVDVRVLLWYSGWLLGYSLLAYKYHGKKSIIGPL